jgi:hypothetical protein
MRLYESKAQLSGKGLRKGLCRIRIVGATGAMRECSIDTQFASLILSRSRNLGVAVWHHCCQGKTLATGLVVAIGSSSP